MTDLRSDDRSTTWTSGRLTGALLLAALLVLALGVFDFPNLDGVREDVAIATTVDAVRAGVPADQVSSCFQGFCFEEGTGMFDRWWGFSTTYLRLIWPVLLFAVLAAAVTDVFLFPTSAGPGLGSRLFRTADPSLRSSAPGRARGGDADRVAVGALSAVSIVLAVVLFAPLLVGIRIVLGVGVLAVAIKWGSTGTPTGAPAASAEPWADLALSVWRIALRVGPGIVVAAVLGGLATQYFTEAGVESVVGDHLLGIGVVAAIGLFLRLPLLFEFPLVAGALLVGMGRVTAGVFLLTAALGGPLARRLTARAVLAAGLTFAVVVAGGGVALAVSGLVEKATVPTVTFDGEECRYTGPMRFAPGVSDFVVRNDSEDEGDGHTLAIVVGRLPDNVSMDHFSLSVAAEPTAPLPSYFTVAGNQEFVFPGTEEVARITFHTPGRYGVVCLDGGGFYVIFEFSMPQPMGWFDEFRSTFTSYVADDLFTVEG